MPGDTKRHIAGPTMFVGEISRITGTPVRAVQRFAYVRGLAVRGLHGEGRRNRVLVHAYLEAIREHYPTEYAALQGHLDDASTSQAG